MEHQGVPARVMRYSKEVECHQEEENCGGGDVDEHQLPPALNESVTQGSDCLVAEHLILPPSQPRALLRLKRVVNVLVGSPKQLGEAIFSPRNEAAELLKASLVFPIDEKQHNRCGDG